MIDYWNIQGVYFRQEIDRRATYVRSKERDSGNLHKETYR